MTTIHAAQAQKATAKSSKIVSKTAGFHGKIWPQALRKGSKYPQGARRHGIGTWVLAAE